MDLDGPVVAAVRGAPEDLRARAPEIADPGIGIADLAGLVGLETVAPPGWAGTTGVPPSAAAPMTAVPTIAGLVTAGLMTGVRIAVTGESGRAAKPTSARSGFWMGRSRWRPHLRRLRRHWAPA